MKESGWNGHQNHHLSERHASGGPLSHLNPSISRHSQLEAEEMTLNLEVILVLK